MAEHTPAPWRIDPGGAHKRPCICGSGLIHTNGQVRNAMGVSSASYSDEVCELHGDLRLPGPMANASLLLAAPALVEACRAWMDFNKETKAENPCPDYALRAKLRERAKELSITALALAQQEKSGG